MDRTASLLIDKRKTVITSVLLIAVICALLALRVPVNTDMTKYLPDDSSMKIGLDLMKEEFPDQQMDATIRVMFAGLTEEEQQKTLEILRGFSDAAAVEYDASQDNRAYHKDGYTLYIITINGPYRSEAEAGLKKDLREHFAGYDMVFKNDDTTTMDIPLLVFALALVILLAVLFAMCGSWAEPFVFLAVIGIAIVINLGTNIVLGSVSQTTFSMTAILQLVLSMDYSIILMNRYRQETAHLRKAGDPQERDLEKAMKQAWLHAFSSVAGSGFTTVVGLLMLIFMRFKIGKDLGLVLAKGVFCSMVCVLTLLPALILHFDRLIDRTRKNVLHIPTGPLARFGYRMRYVLGIGFIILFAVTWYIQSRAGISYSLNAADPIAEVFPLANPVVVLYDNEDEEEASRIAARMEEDPDAAAVLSYSTTLGRQYDPQGMTHALLAMAESPQMASAAENAPELLAQLDEGKIRMLYLYYRLKTGKETMSIHELFSFVTDDVAGNPEFSGILGESALQMLGDMKEKLESAAAQMKGKNCSRLVINTFLPLESEETTRLIRELDETCRSSLKKDYYLIGNSCMGYEMEQSFDRELLMITLLTAVSIFIVVAVTFRKLVIPLILVLLVQCGVFMTVMTTSLLGYKMYYLAIVIVQCILMGATVDYGILFTNYYRELRKTKDVRNTLISAYEASIHTILTSSLFMIFGTGAIGFSPVEPTISQICQSIALGAASATLLILLVLPGMLAALDRFVVRKEEQ